MPGWGKPWAQFKLCFWRVGFIMIRQIDSNEGKDWRLRPGKEFVAAVWMLDIVEEGWSELGLYDKKENADARGIIKEKWLELGYRCGFREGEELTPGSAV